MDIATHVETADQAGLNARYTAADEAARIGGAILQDWATRFTAREKSPANLVTEADLASQKAIFDYLHERFPDDRFVGEEDLGDDAPAQGDGSYQWYVDPLDGTGNYVHGFPYYAVSIGLACHGRLHSGHIFDPTRGEMFAATVGGGAFLNGQPMQVAHCDTLGDAFCVASLPVATDPENIALERFLRVAPRVQTVQRTGSAALNLCYVACGRIDAFWSTSLSPWDKAAGVVLVQEAGGTISACGGGPFDLHVRDVLATGQGSMRPLLIEALK